MATQNKSRYLPIIENFKAGNPDYKVLSNSELEAFLVDALPFGAMNKVDSRIPIAKRFVEWLDEDLKLGSSSGSNLINNINLLPLFDEWSAEYAENNFASHYKEKGIKQLNKARQILLDSYIDTEIVNMNNQNIGSVTAATEEERRSKAAERVNSDAIYSPTYRAVSASTGVSPITGQVGQEYVGSGLEPETFEDYLRLNPNSTVYNLIEMETINAGDESFSEGFDATMFAGWLTNKQRNEANAKKEDGSSALWSPTQAIKFIYDLADEGNTKKINELQTMLRQAGYFTLLGDGGVLPIPGVVDTAMEQAWGLFLTDAARMNKTPADMFKDKKMQYAKMVTSGQGLIGEDKAGISQDIDVLSFEVLGRRLSPAEKQSLYTAVRGWEREQLSSQLYSQQPTTIDIDARLAQLIESTNANEIAFNIGESMNEKFRKWYGD